MRREKQSEMRPESPFVGTGNRDWDSASELGRENARITRQLVQMWRERR